MKKKFLFLTLLLGIIGLTSCVGNDNPTESSSSTQEVSNTSSTSTGKPSSSTTSTPSSTSTGKPSSSATSAPSSSTTSTPSSSATSTPSSTSTSTHNHDYSEEWSSDSTNHWHECSCGEKELQAAHTYGDFVVTKEATHTEDGSKKQTCSVCGYENVVVIPQLGHDLVHHDAKNPTCTEIGWNEYYTCSSCDYTTYQEIAALGHNYGNPVWTWD